jgi:LPXTG-site transpeptidase (sortase) family protein
MHRRVLVLLCLALIGVAWPQPRPLQADTQAGTPLLFAETGHTLAYAFRQFYDTHGGQRVFGLPLSEVYLEAGIPVQYFERARLEWHAQHAQVVPSLLGSWAAQERQHLAAFRPLRSAPPDTVFFPETGHTLRGGFLQFWQQHGGLAVFGYPISEAFVELHEQDGQTYVMQYFERARFEWHPAQPPGSRVQPSHLGRAYLATHPAPAWAMQPVASSEAAWAAVRPTAVQVPRIGLDTAIAPAGFAPDEWAWDMPRYTAAHYWPISGYPATAGNIVLAGHVGYSGTIFSSLPDIRVGDEVFVTVNGGQQRYVVDEVLVLLPEDTWVMLPTPDETLTLITCIPVGVYSHRLVTRASPAP